MKNENKNAVLIHLWILGIRLSILLIMSCFFFSCSEESDTNNLGEKNDIIQLTNWQYYSSTDSAASASRRHDFNNILTSKSWVKLSSEKGLSHKSRIVWIHTILPAWRGNDPALYIGQVDYALRVFLNNKEVDKLGSFKSGKFLGWDQSLIDLPYLKKGDIITISIRSEDDPFSFKGKALLGSSDEITRQIFMRNVEALFFAVIYFAAGIILYIIYFGFHREKLLIGIAVFLTAEAIFIIGNSLFLQMIFKAPAIFYNLDYISFISASTGGLFAIEQIVHKRYSKIIRILWQTHFAVLILSILLVQLTKITFLDILPYFLILLIISILITFVIMYLGTKAGNFESKILMTGMSTFFFFAILEISFYSAGIGNRAFGYSPIVLQYGVLAFMISLIWIVINNYLKTYKENEVARKKEFEAVKRENEIRHTFTTKILEYQEVERNRIALELHDSVGQKLLLIKNQVLSGVNQPQTDNNANTLSEVGNLADETIQEVRNITYNLRPQYLDQLGLTAAVESMVEKIVESSEINICLNIDNNIDNMFPKNEEINFFRIIQESLNNIVKHSGADEAFINIKREDNMVLLKIRDNGKGFQTSGVNSGTGITGMHERAKILNAGFNIVSNETGTFIKLAYPIKIESKNE